MSNVSKTDYELAKARLGLVEQGEPPQYVEYVPEDSPGSTARLRSNEAYTEWRAAVARAGRDRALVAEFEAAVVP